MSLINEYHDSLPYVDGDLTPQLRAELNDLINQELPANYQSVLHHSIPDLPLPQFSSFFQQELDRKAKNDPMTGGIDLSRYEAPDPPASAQSPNADPITVINDWRKTLQQAYAASEHLSTRQENLELLSAHGKNAWLIGNSQLEEILRQSEKELQEIKDATELVNKERKTKQEIARGELTGLEDAWRRALSGTIDTEIATQNLRMEILDKRRQQAQQQLQS
ncbi:hypothetical protein FQN57_004314 [Myotisia sp. PD_48]|nr:hypothetical protein FQN57_004314 [Myotisia sp. PD_48]